MASGPDIALRVWLVASAIFVGYCLAGLASTMEAETRCEEYAREGVVIKASVDFFALWSKRCIYADEQGLVHEVVF